VKDGGIEVKIECDGSDSAVNHDDRKELTLYPHFLLGCDGMNSRVRKYLARHAPPTYPESASEDREGSTRLVNKERFEPLQFDTESAGLNYKILTIKDRFPLPSFNKELKKLTGKSEDVVRSEPGITYAIR
jgi:hypothetical protein